MLLQRPLVSVLSLSIVMLLLLSPSVTSQNSDLIPDFCETKRPSKSSENCETERRYFLHATKGCKAFAICKEQVAELDTKDGINYFQSKELCRAACAQGIVCPELNAPENGSVVSDGFMSWGGTVEYSCNEGYALVGYKDRTCTREATWSNNEPTCEKQCSPPPNVAHATIGPVHNYYNKGTRIFYTCEEGYASQVVERTCESGGVWSGQEPVCEFQVMQCPEPELIHNGKMFVPDRSVGQIVTYTCDEHFILIGNATRTCSEDARWEGDAPICWKLTLEYPENTDITNQTLTLAPNTLNACVKTKSSHPDPLSDVVPVWYFNDEILRVMEYPHGVELEQGKLKFTNVLQSREQEGIYTMKLGPYSIYFHLKVEDANAAPTTTPGSVIEPNIFVSPRSVVSSLGNSIRFSCVFTGCPPPNVTWFHNDSAISLGGRVNSTIHPSHTYTVCHLDISDVSDMDVGWYKCVGENSGGVTSSAAVNLTLDNVASTNARRKRSEEDASSWSENSICEQVLNQESVTIIARPRKELRRLRSLKELRNYRFEVSQVLKGTLQSSSSSSSSLVGKRRLRVVVLDSSTKLHLNSDEQYILNGRMSDNVMYISGPQHIHHFTTELENHIQSC